MHDSPTGEVVDFDAFVEELLEDHKAGKAPVNMFSHPRKSLPGLSGGATGAALTMGFGVTAPYSLNASPDIAGGVIQLGGTVTPGRGSVAGTMQRKGSVQVGSSGGLVTMLPHQPSLQSRRKSSTNPEGPRRVSTQPIPPYSPLISEAGMSRGGSLSMAAMDGPPPPKPAVAIRNFRPGPRSSFASPQATPTASESSNVDRGGSMLSRVGGQGSPLQILPEGTEGSSIDP